MGAHGWVPRHVRQCTVTFFSRSKSPHRNPAILQLRMRRMRAEVGPKVGDVGQAGPRLRASPARRQVAAALRPSSSLGPLLVMPGDASELEELREWKQRPPACRRSSRQAGMHRAACAHRPCCFGAADPASGARLMPSHAHARAWRRPAPCVTAPRPCLQVFGALHPAEKQVRPPSPHAPHSPPAACTRSGPGGPVR